MSLDTKTLERFFKGTYSRADYISIESAFKDMGVREDLRKCLDSQWTDYDKELLPDGNVDHILDRVHHQINLEAGPVQGNRFIQLFRKVAAILIVPLLLGSLAFVFLQPEDFGIEPAMAEIQCPLGVRTKFALPDGTVGFLNSGSTLEYPVHFQEERRVTLIGEAYFDVSHDKAKPFIVNTPHLHTHVLGTQFNVIAYENENSEEIILRDGEVEVYSRGGKKLETLKPEQKLDFYANSRKFGISQVESVQYISWTEGMLVFRNESMEEVAKRLGRWYNVEIEIQDKELLEYSFRATFIDEPLEEVLKLLALTAPMSYEEQERKATNQNLFEKRKVSLSLDHERLNAFEKQHE